MGPWTEHGDFSILDNVYSFEAPGIMADHCLSSTFTRPAEGGISTWEQGNMCQVPSPSRHFPQHFGGRGSIYLQDRLMANVVQAVRSATSPRTWALFGRVGPRAFKPTLSRVKLENRNKISGLNQHQHLVGMLCHSFTRCCQWGKLDSRSLRVIS